MNESERLALELDRAIHGGAWHGPSWRESLEGVDAKAAAQRPLPAAHTIAEIVKHASLWHDVVRRRLEGETPQVPDEQDWRDVVPGGDEAWSAEVAESLASGRALVDTVRQFPVERLHERRPRIESTWYELISGELQHVLYHAGQVALLKKSVAAPVARG